MPAWEVPAIESAFQRTLATHGLKLGKAQAPVRVAVTGTNVGPPLFESLELLGRDDVLRRVRAARDKL